MQKQSIVHFYSDHWAKILFLSLETEKNGYKEANEIKNPQSFTDKCIQLHH